MRRDEYVIRVGGAGQIFIWHGGRIAAAVTRAVDGKWAAGLEPDPSCLLGVYRSRGLALDHVLDALPHHQAKLAATIPAKEEML